MIPQFFGQQIEVALSGDLGIPVSFCLDGRKYAILEIIDAWQDYGFGRAPLKRKRWWNRRHRNYYRVKTGEGDVFEIYHDRGTSLEQAREENWFLYRQV